MTGAPRTLIAAFGNELRADDGFGLRVLETLVPHADERPWMELFPVGTGGIRLAQHLLGSYDHLIVLDAMYRDGPPGTLYVLEIDEVTSDESVDLHLATPARALSLARELDALPPQIHMVGCEPETVDDLDLALTPNVAAAVEGAVRAVLELADAYAAGFKTAPDVATSGVIE
jgi:hydrogenase maturation protease